MIESSELNELPVYPFLGEIADRVLSSPSKFLVLTAETGAGKSTAVPVGLLDRVPGKIVMLEPRRIATVAIADRIASLLGEETGETAGYRVHLDGKTGPKTKIEIITEAILTRRIQNDPALKGVSVVILDEFHERSIHSDLALALLREIVSLRDDLYVIVMSATIDATAIAESLAAPTMEIPGRRFPVEIEYASPSSLDPGLSVFGRAARAVGECLRSPGGNILVFLPGIYEITKARELLASCGAELLVLHSSVPFAEQRKVLEWRHGPAQARRVILSSSVAETSLTVPGVSVVIDSGLSRITRFNVATGMDRLVTETESEFQATQRAGRAGRTGPGKCVRLWARHDVRVASTPPEISRSDIVPLVLECALWGVTEPDGLAWLDKPNAASWRTSQDLLFSIGALDRDGRITDRGRLLSSLGAHPRIGSVALEGETALAARYSGYSDNQRERERFTLDLERRIGSRGKKAGAGSIALLAGFPDRIARHTGDGVYQFPSGRLASLPKSVRSATARPPEWIVAPEVDAGDREGRIYSFEALDEKTAEAWLEKHCTKETRTEFQGGKYVPGAKTITTEFRLYGKLVLGERRLENVPGDAARAIVAAVRKDGLALLPWAKASEDFLARARFRELKKNGLEGGKSGDDALLASLEEWLVPFIPADGRIFAETLLDALRWHLDGSSVDRDVPQRILLANGLSRPLLYEELAPGEGPIPVLETRIQDLFGCPDTPRILGTPVLLRLLSPAKRPLQITRDLAGFWKNTWPEVIKEMKGRYPKHKWPENPLSPLQ